MNDPVKSSKTAPKLFTFVEDRSQLDTINEEKFSGNYVIHAYESGKLKGREEQIKDLKAAIRDKNLINQDYTISVIGTLVGEMINDGVLTKGGWLKKESSSKFDALISVPEEVYLSDKINDYYIKAFEIEKTANNPNYTLNIRFINEAKSINANKLDCDGYKLRFNVEVN